MPQPKCDHTDCRDRNGPRIKASAFRSHGNVGVAPPTRAHTAKKKQRHWQDHTNQQRQQNRETNAIGQSQCDHDADGQTNEYQRMANPGNGPGKSQKEIRGWLSILRGTRCRAAHAGTICPLTSPKPIRYPSPSPPPMIFNLSLSSSHLRVSPFGNCSGLAPRQVSSSMHPRDSSLEPLIAPLGGESIFAVCNCASSFMSKVKSLLACKYGSGFGSCGANAFRKGSSASNVTT